jgi:hypothetical protein
VIKNNIVKNVNSVGINLQDSFESARIIVENNDITTNIYGSHVHGWLDSGYGIAAHSIFAFRNMSGYTIDIRGNNIECKKPGYSGINICGSFNTPDVAKFLEGTVSGNNIHLNNGLTGIKVGRNDKITVSENTLKGRAYYGIRVHGKSTPNDIEIYSENNVVTNNDMQMLRINECDQFSCKLGDGISFALGGSTAHIWLDDYSKNNLIHISSEDTIIDHGLLNDVKIV